ncbi:putative inactive receptor kinase [Forsythia ovata]|uniref:Inactive receptor kinase n=1 Tax=Forsythia ovata TaxID=205694 RepID=A0ABD1WC67_9LAMI
MRAVRRAKEAETLKAVAQSPSKSPPIKVMDEAKPEERHSELVFFVEKEEWFKLEDLLEAAADLHTQGLWSSLYMVQLKNNAMFAVKRLKKLVVSFEEFGLTMGKIGNLKHQHILPLIGYNSTDEEKLLIYRYQRNGSLLTLFDNYIEGKRNFPWKLRLSIAAGIARGLEFIYRRFDDHDEIIPHGNIKPSNILLSDSEEPLISDYGYSKFLDPSIASIFKSNGYTAPEKTLSEKADVFSFGIILLELLTGKIVERSGLDLPRWVKSMVREEWTGEVFDREVSMVEMN